MRTKASWDCELFHPIVQNFLETGRFFVLADYVYYIEYQENAGKTYSEPDRWTRMEILNVARSGKFLSNRTIKEYAKEIWDISPVKM